jgi:hypothetical protein
MSTAFSTRRVPSYFNIRFWVRGDKDKGIFQKNKKIMGER